MELTFFKLKTYCLVDNLNSILKLLRFIEKLLLPPICISLPISPSGM